MTPRNVEFWSSAEYASFLGGLTKELGAAGWPARQRFGVTQARYWAARTRWQRWKLRFRCYGLYPLALARRFWSAQAGTVGVVCTNTFYAPLVAEWAAPAGVPVVHWVLDLFPDVLVLAGSVRRDGLVERGLRRIVAKTFRRAAANVFLGEHLLNHAQSKFGPIPRAVVIPVGADGAPFRAHAPVARSGRPTILYCGNLGRMHDIATVAEVIAAGSAAAGAVKWVFRANGAGLRELRARLAAAGKIEAVEWGENLAEAEWPPAMLAADVALVTMRPGAEGLVMPSKTYSAMVAGQAILAVCPGQSDLADTVRKHGCGWVIEPGDEEGLGRVVLEIAGDPAGLLAKRRAAYAAGHTYYDQVVLARQWTTVLQEAASWKGGAASDGDATAETKK